MAGRASTLKGLPLVRHHLREALTVLRGMQYGSIPRPLRAGVETCVRLLTESLDVLEPK